MNKSGKLVAAYEVEAEVFNNFFASVVAGNPSSHTSKLDGQQGSD